MPRHPRLHASGLLFHIMVRGNNKQDIFLDSTDYEEFLDAIEGTRTRYPFYLYAYVLMPNHFHLLVEVRQTPTARLMQALLTRYARGFNRRHQRSGPVFQGRYKAIVCEQKSYLLELTRYIHLNPVRAGFVRRPGKWPWSGHSEYLGKTRRGLIDSGPVQEILGSPGHYDAFVREGLKDGYRPEWHPGQQLPVLGPERFKKRILRKKPLSSSHPRLSLKALWRQTATKAEVPFNLLRSGGRSAVVVAVRDSFIRQAVDKAGYRAAVVAAFVGCHPSNITRALRKGGVE